MYRIDGPHGGMSDHQIRGRVSRRLWLRGGADGEQQSEDDGVASMHAQ
jgi:hypothetical protein